MKIRENKAVKNQTKLKLVPITLTYGVEFVEKINGLSRKAWGIGDSILENNQQLYGNHIFLLVDVNGKSMYGNYKDKNKSRHDFDEFLKWFKTKDYYENDYPYDGLEGGHYHMLIIKFPEEYKDSLKAFRESRYSEMLPKKEIDRLFPKEIKRFGKMIPNDQYFVLHKDDTYKHVFADKLKKEFNLNEFLIEEDDNRELDFPVNIDEEIF